MPFIKPTIVMSKCLLNGNCHNGCVDMVVDKLKNNVKIISVCPLEKIGFKGNENDLIVEFSEEFHLINKNNKKDYTKYLNEYSEELIKNDVDAFLFKSNSNTCGVRDINVYDKKGNILDNKSSGLFTYMLKNKKNVIFEDNDTLLKDNDRDYFFTKLFCLSEFERINKEKDFTKLLDFHRKNKYLFKLYDNKSYEMLDLLINTQQCYLFSMYEQILRGIFQYKHNKEEFKSITYEIIDQFKDYINLKEQKFIKELLSDFDDNAVSKIIIEYLLKNNLLRFNIENYYNQTIFEKYPKELRVFEDD